ncbi:MAG: tyrosine-type recombinase/integrase [Armatimonadota bacterium]
MRKQTHLTPRGAKASAATIDTAIEAFYRRCQAKNLSAHTVSFYKYRLQAFKHFLDERYPEISLIDITSRVIRDFIAHEGMRVSAATADDSFVTLRVIFRYLEADGVIEESPMTGVERPKTKKTLISAFSAEQVEAMIGVCGNDFTGVRNRAIIITFVDCGLRVSELCGLQTDHINWSEQTMVVTGKGNKERRVPFGRVARSTLFSYWERRGDIPGTKEFFLSCYGDPLDRFRVAKALAECGRRAGVTGVRISPHTFRHTFAVMYLRNGGDVFSLQKMLGHTDLTMTRRYAELSQTDVIEKHRQFSPADAIKTPSQSGRKRLK